MKSVLPVIVAALAVAAPARTCLAQEGSQNQAFYRVEAIVFSHAGGDSDAWPEMVLADHSGALDPSWRAFAREQKIERLEAESANRDSELAAALDAVETIASLESGEQSLTQALLYPEPWISLEEPSEPMSQALARLERSGAYRVHAWSGWYQPLGRSTSGQAVRIHDDRLVAVDWIELSPTGRLLRDGRPVETVERLAPAFHFRLDGTIRLRQRQFMHADVALDWRVPETIGPSPWSVLPGDDALEGHRIDQSRTIRPNRFEYFDSEWLGLLLRVTPFQPEPDNDDENPEIPDGETPAP